MTNNLLVLQSDFGLVDGAVSAMIGVALQEEPSLEFITLHMILHPTTLLKLPIVCFRLSSTGQREQPLFR